MYMVIYADIEIFICVSVYAYIYIQVHMYIHLPMFACFLAPCYLAGSSEFRWVVHAVVRPANNAVRERPLATGSRVLKLGLVSYCDGGRPG